MYDLAQNDTIAGWMQLIELAWLYDQARHMNSIVEIGSWKGRSAYALASGCKGNVYCIDTWKGSTDEIDGAHQEAKTIDIFDLFLQNVGHFPNIVPIVGDSHETAKAFEDKTIDMVFIDGCHLKEHAKLDIINWLPKCTRLLCGHDYHQAFIGEIAKELNLEMQPIEIGSLWVYKGHL